MSRRNLDENREAALRSARYRLARDVAEEQVPVDEYAERTGRRLGDGSEPATEVRGFHADDEVWEVANSALDAAFARGDFDNLAYAGKPIPGLGSTADPDWWIKGLMKREHISGVGPPALLLRKEDEELEGTLDRMADPAAVRDLLEDFNARIIEARRQLLGGPPVITALRDVEDEVASWRERRTTRAVAAAPAEQARQEQRPRWFGRLFGSAQKR
ncbi:DnaJ family domain-containing protein [Paeniglutamicibacter psychrophenolicus]|uniref:DnaJ family domain-containing protein n=1 Tax=Paeniglutamicibacter psychrophenolicus TaxID=257454 RepID=UPI00277E0B95|nr:DUF1992 domain-containing protein [Paeniglutamicibacter psychrophenolicus]MDQ0095207.1 hypothetical protein [Paeniglutamicibacter psychrophenolicus]